MPNSSSDEHTDAAIERQIEGTSWEARKITTRSLFKKEYTSDYLVWNDTYAFVLHPVKLTSKFSISPGRKSTKLVHRGHSINPWLLYLINKRLPLWRSKNASMMLVLLDVENKNGVTSEAIGVSIPDSKKKIPVGIYPGKNFLNSSSKKSAGVLDDIEKKYSSYLTTLTEKQKKAMSEIGLSGESEYLTEEETPAEAEKISN